MAITITQLRSFLAVLRTGSVTGAADDLFVTQPSVSAAVSALSAELGVQLTERVGRGVASTAAGQAFAPYAADVIGLLDEGARAAHEAAQGRVRELRIAAVTTAAEYIVPPLMRAFSDRHPDLRLTVEVGNRDQVFRRVADHEADVAVGGRPPARGRLTGLPFVDNPIVLITAPDDPLARRASVPVGELSERPWLLREAGSGTRTMIEEFLARHELRPPLLTLGSNGAIKQGARAGLGVSLQSMAAAELELELGMLTTIAIDEPLPAREWFVLRSATGPVREAVRLFMEFAASDGARAALDEARATGAAAR